MSGKENKIEEEEEEEETKVARHWSHEHRLTLVERRLPDGCSGCGKHFSGGGKAYECRCLDGIVLDEECLGMPREIRHTMHPQHILTQYVMVIHKFDKTLIGKLCAICERFDLMNIGRGGRILYRCTGSECVLWMHMRCAQGSDMMYDAADDDDDEQHRTINHRSHPKHELKLVRRSCRFKCDACGITRGGKSYMCCKANCQYWIHQSCASLPQTFESEYHSHSLSLSFHVPPRYIKKDIKCIVCRKNLPSKYWIYHCEICRYVVHLKCSYVFHLKCASNATRYVVINIHVSLLIRCLAKLISESL